MKKVLIILMEEFKYRLSKHYLFVHVLMIILLLIRNFFEFDEANSQLGYSGMIMILMLILLNSTPRPSILSTLPVNAKEFFLIKTFDNLINSAYLTILFWLVQLSPYIMRTNQACYQDAFTKWLETGMMPVFLLVLTFQILMAKDLIESVMNTIAKSWWNNMAFKQGIATIIGILPLIVLILLMQINLQAKHQMGILFVGTELIVCSLPMASLWYFSRRMSELPIRK